MRLTKVMWMARFSLQHYVSALAETVAATSSEGGLASRQAVNQTVMPGRPTRWADSCGGGGSGILGTIRCFFGGAPVVPLTCWLLHSVRSGHCASSNALFWRSVLRPD